MTRSINIVIGNHSSYWGIEDYAHYLIFTLSQLGFRVSESMSPRKDVAANIWIEGFGPIPTPTLHSSRSSDTPPDFIVCTEYPFRSRTFNVFGLSDRIFAFVRLFVPVRLIIRNIFFPTNRLLFYLSILLALPFVALGCLIGLTPRETIYRLELAARFINLTKISNQVTGFIVISEDLKLCYQARFPSVPVHILTPLLPELAVTAKPNTFSFCFLSGKMTAFRKKWIREAIFAQDKIKQINFLTRYASRKEKNDIPGRVDFTKLMDTAPNSACMFLGASPPSQALPEASNGDDKLAQYIIFEVYVGQTRTWPFASPIRDYRALRNGHISITAGDYKGELFTDLTIKAPKHPVDFIKFIQTVDINYFFDSLPNKIDVHNSHYLSLNRAVVQTILPIDPSLRPAPGGQKE